MSPLERLINESIPDGSYGQAVRALLAERRARLYAQDRFTASTRRSAWRLIRTARKAGQ